MFDAGDGDGDVSGLADVPAAKRKGVKRPQPKLDSQRYLRHLSVNIKAEDSLYCQLTLGRLNTRIPQTRAATQILSKSLYYQIALSAIVCENVRM